jgi:hypothetical protein
MIAKNVLIISGVLLFISLLGCIPFISGKGGRVHIENNAEVIRNCKSLGTVKGSASLGWKAMKVKISLNEIRNKAALLGANTVLIVSTDSMFKGTVITGIAYDCPENGD